MTTHFYPNFGTKDRHVMLLNICAFCQNVHRECRTAKPRDRVKNASVKSANRMTERDVGSAVHFLTPQQANAKLQYARRVTSELCATLGPCGAPLNSRKNVSWDLCLCCSQCRLVQHVNDVAAADRKRMNVNPLGVFLRCAARIYHCLQGDHKYTSRLFHKCQTVTAAMFNKKRLS